MTGFSKQCEILSQLWMDYRDNEDFEDFITYNDLGLPLAHFIHEQIVKSTPQAEMYIGETFSLFIAALEADPEEDYESLEDLLVRYGK
jgi:hypothetical protein